MYRATGRGRACPSEGPRRKSLHDACRLRAGAAPANCFREGEIAAPFGGMNALGFGGCDNGNDALKQDAKMKTIWIELEVS